MTSFTQYTGTFTKKNGSTRTMDFIKVQDLPKGMVNESKTTNKDSSTQVVYDTSARGFRTFNYGTQVGQITQKMVNYSFDS
jgi:hypothetical protein